MAERVELLETIIGIMPSTVVPLEPSTPPGLMVPNIPFSLLTS